MGGLILLVFIIAVVYAIHRSKRRWRTTLYLLLGMLAGVAAYVVTSYFVGLSGYAAGEISVSVGLLCGALTALIHSRRSTSVGRVAHI